MSRPPMDWRDPSVTRTQAMRDLGNLPWAPRDTEKFRLFQWTCVILMVLASLMGLLVVGL